MHFLTNTTISNVDIFIYVFIGIFCIIGLFKGFVKIVFSFLKGFAAFIISYFLTEPLCKIISSTNIDYSIKNKILEWMVAKVPTLNNQIDITNYQEQIASAIEEVGIPRFIGNLISSVIEVNESQAGFTIGEILSSSLTQLFLVIISFVVLFITISFLIFILFKIFKMIVDKGGLKIIDKLLGLILNGVIGLFIIALTFMLINGLSVLIPSIGSWLEGLIYVEGVNEEAFSIAKYLYENNPLRLIFENLLDN